MRAHEHGIQLRGAWILRDLSLQQAKLELPVWVSQSTFSGHVDLLQAHLRVLNLHGSWLQHGLQADSVQVGGDVVLDEGFRSDASIQLSFSSIKGSLRCENASFFTSNKDRFAIEASAAQVANRVHLRSNCVVEGGADLRDIRIGGVLDCTGSKFTTMQIRH